MDIPDTVTGIRVIQTTVTPPTLGAIEATGLTLISITSGKSTTASANTTKASTMLRWRIAAASVMPKALAILKVATWAADTVAAAIIEPTQIVAG